MSQSGGKVRVGDKGEGGEAEVPPLKPHPVHQGTAFPQEADPASSGLLHLSLQRLLAERDSLREANDELRCTQLQPRGLTQAGELRTCPRA